MGNENMEKRKLSLSVLLRLTFGIVVAAIITPLVLIIQFPLRLFGLHRAKRTPEELAAQVRSMRDGTLGQGWDEFECVPIKDPRLEEIRLEALSVRLPLDNVGRAKLSALLDRLRRLSS